MAKRNSSRPCAKGHIVLVKTLWATQPSSSPLEAFAYAEVPICATPESARLMFVSRLRSASAG
jgi:hypothetical protein